MLCNYRGIGDVGHNEEKLIGLSGKSLQAHRGIGAIGVSGTCHYRELGTIGLSGKLKLSGYRGHLVIGLSGSFDYRGG